MVGCEFRGYEGIQGDFGFDKVNVEGKPTLDFALTFNLNITNRCFKKRTKHLIMYKSWTTCSQINFFLVRRSDRALCTNCKVIRGESFTTQHRVLVMDVFVKNKVGRKNHKPNPRIRWWELKDEAQELFKTRMLAERVKEIQGDANHMWNTVTESVS